MNNVFEKLIEDDVKFYSDNLIHWLVTINCIRKSTNIASKLEKGLQYSPVGDIYIDAGSNENIEIQTEIWSTSESKEFLDTALNMIKNDLKLSLPRAFKDEYIIKVNKDDIEKEYVDIDDLGDMTIKEYNNLYRCLKHETDYFNSKRGVSSDEC